MNMKRWGIISLVLGLILFTFPELGKTQRKYPDRSIEVVVPFGPGGQADVGARVYCEELARILKVPIFVVNQSGGAGVQGTAHVINSKRDGYILLATPQTPLVIMPLISKEANYEPFKDLIPLGNFAYVYSGFTVRADSQFQTLNDMIEYARKNPGKLKNASGGGFGSESYINHEILCLQTNIKIPTIPFKSSPECIAALLGGHVDLTIDSLISIGSQIKAGKLRCLAIASPTRHPDFPNIPTMAESGYPDVNLSIWHSIYVANGVPQQVLDVLIPAVEKAFKNPEVVQRATKAGYKVEYMGPDELLKLNQSAVQIVDKVVKRLNLIRK